jgi:hypothetical protein
LPGGRGQRLAVRGKESLLVERGSQAVQRYPADQLMVRLQPAQLVGLLRRKPYRIREV